MEEKSVAKIRRDRVEWGEERQPRESWEEQTNKIETKVGVRFSLYNSYQQITLNLKMFRLSSRRGSLPLFGESIFPYCERVRYSSIFHSGLFSCRVSRTRHSGSSATRRSEPNIHFWRKRSSYLDCAAISFRNCNSPNKGKYSTNENEMLRDAGSAAAAAPL